MVIMKPTHMMLISILLHLYIVDELLCLILATTSTLMVDDDDDDADVITTTVLMTTMMIHINLRVSTDSFCRAICTFILIS